MERFRVAKRELTLVKACDHIGRRVTFDLRELKPDLVQTLDGTCIIVVVMRHDHALRNSVEGPGLERQGQDSLRSRERFGDALPRAGRWSTLGSGGSSFQSPI